MSTKVAPKEDDDLEEIVEEAQRLEDAEREKLTQQEKREVLRELDIAPEKLEAAEAAVAARRAEEAKKRRTMMIVAAAIVAVAGIAAGAFAWSRHTAGLLAGIAVSEHAVSVDGKPAPFAAPGAEVKLDATLTHAPVGHAVELTCTWRDAGGAVAHQNKWTTKTIDREVWGTHCRTKLGASAPPGTWSVTMEQGGRTLAKDSFTVRER